MRIVVNHLTRMEEGYCCVAGIDPETQGHIRPVLPAGQRLSTGFLQPGGGAFNMATEVDIGETQVCGQPPHVEDYAFEPIRAIKVRDVDPSTFWVMLQTVAATTLQGVFGDALKPRGNTCAVELSTGRASLGCLELRQPPTLEVHDFGDGPKIRAHLSDGVFTCSVSVADIRLYETDHRTPRRAEVERLSNRIASGVGAILSVGLARPWLKPGDTVERNWLQVNDLHLADDPTWKLG